MKTDDTDHWEKHMDRQDARLLLMWVDRALAAEKALNGANAPVGTVGEARYDQPSNVADYGNSPREIQRRALSIISSTDGVTDEAADRIEQLEAALREILAGHPDAYDLARIALDQSSPPEAVMTDASMA